MKARIVTVLVFIVLFISGWRILNLIMPLDDPGSTEPYIEKVSTYIPPAVNIAKKFNVGGMSLATVSMEEYEKISSTKGSENFMSVSALDGDLIFYSIIQVNYYSIIAKGGVSYVVLATKKILPSHKKGVRWWYFSPLENCYLSNGKLHIPMKAHPKKMKFFIWIVLFILNIVICLCFSSKLFKFLERKHKSQN